MIFDLRHCHLGDVLLAAPAVRAGDSLIAAPSAQVPGLPVTWLDAGTGALVRTAGRDHETESWLQASGRAAQRHQLLPPAERTELLLAPDVRSPRREWSRWDRLAARLPSFSWLTSMVPRAVWMATLNRAHTVVCPDTGTAHMADALGVPRVIALHGMGAGHFRRFRPFWNSQHCIVRDSMDEITLADVLEALGV